MKKTLSLIVLMLGCLLVLAGCSATCKAEGCQNEPVEKSKYCSEHICAEPGCLNGKIGENYCEEHFACAADECTAERVLDGKYCAEHKKLFKMEEFGAALDNLLDVLVD